MSFVFRARNRGFGEIGGGKWIDCECLCSVLCSSISHCVLAATLHQRDSVVGFRGTCCRTNSGKCPRVVESHRPSFISLRHRRSLTVAIVTSIASIIAISAKFTPVTAIVIMTVIVIVVVTVMFLCEAFLLSDPYYIATLSPYHFVMVF